MNQCKGICENLKISVRYGTQKYGNYKYCSKCCIFMDYMGLRCPCCGIMLRTTSRCHYTRKNRIMVRI